jgi:hypothetical protein
MAPTAQATPTLYTDEASFKTGLGILPLVKQDFTGVSINPPATKVTLPGFSMTIFGPPGFPTDLYSETNPQFCDGTCISAEFGELSGALLFTFDKPTRAVSFLMGDGHPAVFDIAVGGNSLPQQFKPQHESHAPNGPPGFDFLGVIDKSSPFSTLLVMSDSVGIFDIDDVQFEHLTLRDAVPAPAGLPLLATALLFAAGLRARGRRAP